MHSKPSLKKEKIFMNQLKKFKPKLNRKASRLKTLSKKRREIFLHFDKIGLTPIRCIWNQIMLFSHMIVITAQSYTMIRLNPKARSLMALKS